MSFIRRIFVGGGGGGPKRPAASASDEPNFLPQGSVVISDRTRHANKLGEGSFAKVYRGEYNGEPCAVKVFKEDVLWKEMSPDPGSEFEMLSNVQHPNIVQVYGMWYDPHKDKAAPSIVMELCNESLYEFIRRSKGKVLSKDKKFTIMRDIARGMVYLHNQNIVHCDLRSSNVLLIHFQDKTTAKVADFDMARLFDPDTQRHLTTRFTDEEYLPPEVFVYKDHKYLKKKWALLTPKVDVFCFGEVVLEMGCGRYPTPDKKYGGREVMTELQRRNRYLIQLKQSDKDSLATITQKCLADDPDSRPTFTDILQDVERYMHMYGERPDLEKLQDKTAECETLRAQALKWEDDAKDLVRTQDRVDMLERELVMSKTENQDLQKQLSTVERENAIAQSELRDRLAKSQQQLTEELEMAATQREEDEKRVNDKVAKLDRQLAQAKMLKDNSDTERNAAVSGEEQAKQELKEAQQKEQKLNVELRQYHDELKNMKSQLDTLKRNSDTTEADLRASLINTQQQLTKEREMAATQRQKEEIRVRDEVAKLERQLDHARTQKDKFDKEQKVAVAGKEEAKYELARVKDDLAREKEDNQARTAAADKTIGCLQQKLEEAQQKEQKLNVELRQYRDELTNMKSASDKLEWSKLTLEEEKAALDNKVRQLSFKLEVRAEDISEKEKQVFSLMKEMEDAQKAIEEGVAMEPVLRRNIEELEEEKQDLMDKLQKFVGKLKKAEKDLSEAKEVQMTLEWERDEKSEANQELQGKCDELLSTKKDLETKLCEMTTSKEATEEQRDKEAKKCLHLEKALNECQTKLEAEKTQLQLTNNTVKDRNAELAKLRAELSAATMDKDEMQRNVDTAYATIKSRDRDLEAALADVMKQREMLSANDVKLSMLAKELVQSQSECDKVRAQMAGVQQDADMKLESLKESKTAVEKDLVRARKMCRDLIDEHVKVNAESEEKMENLNEKLLEFKQQAVLSEERLGQIQGLKEEDRDLKLQLKKLTTALEDFQKLVAIEQKSRRSLDASVKTLNAEVTQLRTDLKKRDEEVGSLAAAKSHLQQKADAADANAGALQFEVATLKKQVMHLSEDNQTLKQTLEGTKAAVQRHKRDYEDNKSQTASLREQVKHLSEANNSLKKISEESEVAIQKHKRDYDNTQEKLREAEHQIAMLQSKRQRLEVLEGVAEELKTQLSGLKTDAYGMSPTLSTEGDGSSASVLVRESTQKVQLLEAERNSYRAERHMYHMKWIAAEDMLKALKKEEHCLEKLRTELKERSEEVGSLAATNKHLQRKADAADTTVSSLRAEVATLNEQAKHLSKDKQELRQALDEAEAAVQRHKIDYTDSQENLELTRQALRAAKVRIHAYEQSLQVEYQKKYFEAFELIKRLLHEKVVEAVPLPPTAAADVIDETVDEVLLQHLCFMATCIKELLVSPDGGTFTLGSGDASLKFPPGAVDRETSIHYAIILHGPFVFPAGYQAGSVVVYLNMDGAILLKPVQLFLSHWCSRDEAIEEDTLTFATASHTLHAKQQCYEFEEQKVADFSTHANIGILEISEPQCLHCVKRRIGKIARYRAVTFSQCIPAKKTLYYRIQFMCDSKEWDQSLTEALRHTGWKKASRDDTVTRFEYSAKKNPIVASLIESEGHGWIASVTGSSKVVFDDFWLPNCKSNCKSEIDQAVQSGQYPPCIQYEIFYSVPREQRVKPAVLIVCLQGEHLNLRFNCRIMEELLASSHLDTSVPSPCSPQEATELLLPSPAPSDPSASVARQLSSPLVEIAHAADVIEALNHELDPNWRDFGTLLRVDPHIMNSIQQDKSEVGACMLQLVEKWVCNEGGTGSLPRTWETMVQAVQGTGKQGLAQRLAKDHGVQLL